MELRLAITSHSPRVDPLRLLLTAAAAAAWCCLPFVIFKSTRIMPGEPRALQAVLPPWGAIGLPSVLLLTAVVALGI
ncbi:MAG: hypothetical protein JO184_17305, partial [Gammaproteobacteria bacterium]|nr:hypothetical protein [Gammaproteobacteria bacterium]